MNEFKNFSMKELKERIKLLDKENKIDIKLINNELIINDDLILYISSDNYKEEIILSDEYKDDYFLKLEKNYFDFENDFYLELEYKFFSIEIYNHLSYLLELKNYIHSEYKKEDRIL